MLLEKYFEGGDAMFFVISIILVAIFFVAACSKVWIHRHTLQSLTPSDWLQFTFGLMMSNAFASIIIIGGMYEMDNLITGIIGAIIKICIILVGLFIASALFIQLMPDKIKPLYNFLKP